MKLQFRMDAFNLTNSIMFFSFDQLLNPQGYGNSGFGQKYLGQSNVGRTLQYSLKFLF